MRGSIKVRRWTRADGRVQTSYYARVYLGTDPTTGRKRYEDGHAYRTRKEAERALNDKVAALNSGTFVPPNRMTVAGYLTEIWLPSVRPSVKASTYANSYRWAIERFLVPMLGARKLQDLTTGDVAAFYGRLLVGDLPDQAKHRGRRNGPLAPKTVINVGRVLSKAMNDAMDLGLVNRNVAAKAKLPRASRKEMNVWSAAQLRRFLAATRDEVCWPIWHLAAVTGMRRGEVLGLRWADVDFDQGRISVRQSLIAIKGVPQISSPKNGRSRVIDLDGDSVTALRQHRKAQVAARLAWGHVDPARTCHDGVHPGRLHALGAVTRGQRGRPDRRPDLR